MLPTFNPMLRPPSVFKERSTSTIVPSPGSVGRIQIPPLPSASSSSWLTPSNKRLRRFSIRLVTDSGIIGSHPSVWYSRFGNTSSFFLWARQHASSRLYKHTQIQSRRVLAAWHSVSRPNPVLNSDPTCTGNFYVSCSRILVSARSAAAGRAG